MKDRKEFRIQTNRGDFRVKIWWDGKDKVYLVKGVSLPDVVTFGETIDEAKKMAQDAIELYCECAIDDGKIVIDDNGKVFGRIPKMRVLAPSQ